MFPDDVGGDVGGVDDNIWDLTVWHSVTVWQVTFVISVSDVMTPPLSPLAQPDLA